MSKFGCNNSIIPSAIFQDLGRDLGRHFVVGTIMKQASG